MRTPALLRLALLAAPLLMPIGLVTGQTSRVSQDSDTGKPRGWLVGGSVGLPVLDGGTSPDLFTVAVHGTQLRPGRLGADFAVGTMPRAFAEGVAIGFGRVAVSSLARRPDPSVGWGNRCRRGQWRRRWKHDRSQRGP